MPSWDIKTFLVYITVHQTFPKKNSTMEDESHHILLDFSFCLSELLGALLPYLETITDNDFHHLLKIHSNVLLLKFVKPTFSNKNILLWQTSWRNTNTNALSNMTFQNIKIKIFGLYPALVFPQLNMHLFKISKNDWIWYEY